MHAGASGKKLDTRIVNVRSWSGTVTPMNLQSLKARHSVRVAHRVVVRSVQERSRH